MFGLRLKDYDSLFVVQCGEPGGANDLVPRSRELASVQGAAATLAFTVTGGIVESVNYRT